MSENKQDLSICLLNDSFPPLIDGVSNTVKNYAHYIEKKHGHSLVITPQVSGADDSVYDFPVVRYPSLDFRKLVGYVAGYPFSPTAARRIREENCQLMHLHCPVSTAILARELHRTLDLPLILTWHTKFDYDISFMIGLKLLQKAAVKALLSNAEACDEIWVVSRGAGENLRSLGYSGDYVIMENGVDLPPRAADDSSIAAATAGYDLPAGVPVFLYVGRIMWYKGLKITIDALAELKGKGIPFRMVFVGGAPERAEIEAYSREQGLSDVCFFTGPIHDRETLRAWYSRADLFLFPSTYDTNGLVVREAAACGTASLLIEGSCAAEGVTDGRNGFLIDENSDAMAAALEQLCAHPDTMVRAGRLAQQEIYLSWETAVDRAAERYRIVIDNFRSGKIVRRPSTPLDIFLRSQGELMDAFSRLHSSSLYTTNVVEEDKPDEDWEEDTK